MDQRFDGDEGLARELAGEQSPPAERTDLSVILGLGRLIDEAESRPLDEERKREIFARGESLAAGLPDTFAFFATRLDRVDESLPELAPEGLRSHPERARPVDVSEAAKEGALLLRLRPVGRDDRGNESERKPPVSLVVEGLNVPVHLLADEIGRSIEGGGVEVVASLARPGAGGAHSINPRRLISAYRSRAWFSARSLKPGSWKTAPAAWCAAS